MKSIWVLIYVYYRLIQEPEIFTDRASAFKRKSALLSQSNPDYDEIEIFEKKIK